MHCGKKSGMSRCNATTTSTQNTIVLSLKQRWGEQRILKITRGWMKYIIISRMRMRMSIKAVDYSAYIIPTSQPNLWVDPILFFSH